MAKNLLIIESPAKARTIQKYLGSDFSIMASVGHVKDLPVNKLGVDVDHDFDPEYVAIKGKGKVLKALKAAGKKAEVIYLAPDPDREGEAIAWHIAQELKKGNDQIYRVLFNELTEKAVRKAIASPQRLDDHKVDSQQARRIMDRLVGYQISPLLWPKVKRGLSAGRVQSVAVKMICDRERQIHAFEPQEYWSLTARLEGEDPPPFQAKLSKWENKKADLKTGDQTEKIVSEIKDLPFQVSKVSRKKMKRNAPPPFITSLMQQEAFRKLRFSAKKTMSVAQSLYEGVEVGDKGQIGLITYMRTDSFHLSDDAVKEARAFIGKTYGQDYVPPKPLHYRSRKGAQQAHEAIRPTSVELEPGRVASFLSKDQLALYSLVWKRFVACQMGPAVFDQTKVDIESGKATFKAAGSILLFKGFTVLYQEASAENGSVNGNDTTLPPLKKGQDLALLKLEPAQHFTQPPPRYTEASLIKALEENGIGRPSTYAAILANISEKAYVEREKRRFKPTELGFLVTDILVKSFPDIMDTAFTAQMESQLDRIEQGKVKWTNVLKKFYGSFKKDLKKAQDEMKGEVLTEITCPDCNRPMAIKSGKNGLFLACTGYPECRHTSNFTRDEKGRIVVDRHPDTGEHSGECEQCGKPMQVKNGKYGPFLACSGYPECKNTRPLEQEGGAGPKTEMSDVRCPSCGAAMLVKTSRTGQRFLACENFPKCTHTAPLSTNVPCPEAGCGGTLVERASKKGRKFYACDQYPKCRFATWDEPFDDTCPQCETPVLSIKRKKEGEPMLVCRKKGCDYKRALPEGE